MFHELVSHNDDIRRLLENGYAVAIDGDNYLVVRDIPYLDQDLRLQNGAFVTKFVDAGQNRIVQENHQVFFAGSSPHGLDGRPIPNLGDSATTLALSPGSSDVVVQRAFSNKPAGTGVFTDFFHKIESYVNIISGPAINLHGANPRTFREVDNGMSTSPFKLRDTLSSRAEICDLSAKLRNDVVAMIGVGGTGAFLLDLLVKSPVREIRGFDPDRFYGHNTYRSPGRVESNEVGKLKADVYQARHDSFRHGLTISPKFIDANSAEDLQGVTFAFVCVDKGTSRAGIFDLLISMNVPFIDVGMGLHRTEGALNGMVRITYYPPESAAAMRDKGLAELVDDPDDLYRTNIQIGELNALNACLAVIKFKQLRGFYHADKGVNHLLFEISNLKAYSDAEARPD